MDHAKKVFKHNCLWIHYDMPLEIETKHTTTE